MQCKQARSLLVHYIEDELDDRQATAVESHVEGCPACAREHELLTQSLALLDEEAPAPELSPAFRAELRRRILTLHQVENSPIFIMRRGFHTILKVFGPPLLGIATCLVSVLPIFQNSPNLRISPFGLLLSGVIWCGLYNALFFAMDRQKLDRALGREPEEAIHLRTILYGTCACLFVVGLGSVFLMNPRLLLPRVIMPNFWANPSGFTVYLSAAAVLVTSVWVGRTSPVNPLGNTFLICGVFCMLLFPSFFISANAIITLKSAIVASIAVFGSGWIGCFLGVLMARTEQRADVLPEASTPSSPPSA